MISYCETNTTISEVWQNGGFGQCFLSTLISCLQVACLIFLGSWQVAIICRWWRTQIHSTAPHSTLRWGFFVPHFCGSLAQTLTPLVHILILTSVFRKPVLGHSVFSVGAGFVGWAVASASLWCESLRRGNALSLRRYSAFLVVFSGLQLVSLNLILASAGSRNWFFWKCLRIHDDASTFEFLLYIVNYVCCFTAFVLAVFAPALQPNNLSQFFYDTLLNAEAATPATGQGSTFRNFWRKVRILAPFIWPRGQCLLQLRVLFCFSLLILGRVVNIYVPIYNKRIIDSLTGPMLTFKWHLIVIYIALKVLQGGAGSGGGGLISIVHGFVWIRVQQYTTLKIQLDFFERVLRLSLHWHLGKKTGEVLRILDRGTDSVDNLLSYLLFSIFPTFIDIFIAITYFVSAFNAWFGLIVFLTMIVYLGATIAISEWRTKFRRELNRLDNEARFKGVDALLNFETVKYFGAESYEVDRYKNAFLTYQGSEWLVNATLSLLNFVQNLLISVGLLTGSLLCAYFVVKGTDGFTVGDYVLFATYILQLYQPLNFLGTYYRIIQRSFIDMENMLDLMKEKPEIEDAPNAVEFVPKAGRIEVKDVSFQYNEGHPVLKNVSFIAEPGQTVALVGPSGSGKSTLVRLLFRFYEPLSGAILYDNQNVKDVKQQSLRRHIGVVPQDTVLFNETLLYNIRYGRTTASDADAHDAALAAEIHDRILTFPQGYDTIVGERGLRLSGGEKQRIAIARTILKASKFLLLDEATSSLDTATERAIKDSLERICSSKTSIIIAHRLSTIVNADKIIVLKDGEVEESGRHEQLLELESGVYRNMWEQQIRGEGENCTESTDLSKKDTAPDSNKDVI